MNLLVEILLDKTTLAVMVFRLILSLSIAGAVAIYAVAWFIHWQRKVADTNIIGMLEACWGSLGSSASTS